MEQALSRLAESVLAGMTKAPGQCEKHGPFERYVREGEEPKCGKCHEEEVAKVERERWLAARNDTLLRIGTLPAKFMGKKWPAATPEQKTARAIVRRFRDFILAEQRWAALVFTGPTGTGKTWLATEFGESMIRNLSKSVRYITAQGIISEIQASYGKEGKSEESEIERFVQYDLLIIDEIDVKRSTDNANLLLTEVINRRYTQEKPVLVITNQAMENLEQFVGDRVFSRLHENGLVCDFPWGDLRRGIQ
jgi:DNA replication protein DnaC